MVAAVQVPGRTGGGAAWGGGVRGGGRAAGVRAGRERRAITADLSCSDCDPCR